MLELYLDRNRSSPEKSRTLEIKYFSEIANVHRQVGWPFYGLAGYQTGSLWRSNDVEP